MLPVVDDTMDFNPQAPTDLDLAADSPVHVMVTARNGVDRAAWARTIHDRSARCDGPFVAVCHHARPPDSRTVGARHIDDWFEQASGGTLFIDLIGRLDSHAQAQLVSRLTEQVQQRSGTTMPHYDVRIVAGSNRSLRPDVAIGTFSSVLFYRLNVIHIDQMHQNDSCETAVRARDVMSVPAHTCAPNTDLAAVATIMWDHDCGFVPVVDASGAVTGVVTDRDICIATATRQLLPEHIPASQAMTAPIHACLADDSISDVLATMSEFQVRRVPVIDADGRLQGVISLNDIVLASNETREPPASDVVATMAAICAHRRVDTAGV